MIRDIIMNIMIFVEIEYKGGRGMKIKGKKSLSSFIKLSLQILLVFGCVVYITLPILLKQYIQYLNSSLQYVNALILLYASGIPAIIIINECIHLFDSLKKEKPFTRQNAKSLKIVSISSLVIAIEYIVGMFFATRSIFALIIIGVFLIAWLGAYVLSKLWEEAVTYKEENDLTI